MRGTPTTIEAELEKLYNEYLEEVESIREYLEEEGLPTGGSTYDAMIDSLREDYPELF